MQGDEALGTEGQQGGIIGLCGEEGRRIGFYPGNEFQGCDGERDGVFIPHVQVEELLGIGCVRAGLEVFLLVFHLDGERGAGQCISNLLSPGGGNEAEGQEEGYQGSFHVRVLNMYLQI